jgi:hypothetical protein
MGEIRILAEWRSVRREYPGTISSHKEIEEFAVTIPDGFVHLSVGYGRWEG